MVSEMRELTRMTVFLDTMTLLHYEWIDQIDWLSLLGVQQVVLVIAPVIFRELDKHKESHPKKRIKTRASSAIQKLFDLLQNGKGKSIRNDVTMLFLKSEPSLSYEQDGLDFKWNDDRLLAHVLEHMAECPDEPVMIVSHDSSVLAKAMLRGISTLDLPKELLLPVELDELEKQNQELERENQKLKNRIPKIGICFDNGKKHTNINMLASSNLLQSAVEKRMASITEEFAPISPYSAMGITQTDMVSSHNSRLQQFFKEYETYLKENLEFWHRVALVQIVLRNTGNTPANDLDVILAVPDSVIAAYDSKTLPRLASKPKPPKARGMFGYDSDMFASLSVNSPNVQMVRAIRELNDSSTSNVERPIFYTESLIEVHYHIKRVKHNLDVPLGRLYLEFASVEAADSFSIACQVTVGNVPDEINTKLNVRVEKVADIPLLEQAEA
ncbi:MAG: PIN domain-containing protein [Armatimonadetes bacterium]|nr:PIN domain-containing protein [Armatimonadota bacterium]